MTQLRFDLPYSLPCLLAGAALLPACIVTDPSDAATDTEASGTETGDVDGGSDTADSTGGTPGDCTPLTQADVETDATLDAGCYTVSQLLSVTHRLDIQGGAEMYFDAASGLFVGNGGVLSAIGTAEAPVVMTGSTAEGWQGIQFLGSASSDNRLEFTQIDGTGATAVEVGGTSRLTVQSSEVSGAPTYGIFAASGAELTVAGSTFTGNGVPLAVALDGVTRIGADNVFDGNDEQVVEVEGGTLAEPARWVSPGVPLRMTTHVRIEGALVLDPGVEIEMPQEGQFTVETSGSLSVQGTTEAPVTFRGVQDERGYWRGISVESKASANVMTGCVLENGGSDGWNGSPFSTAMVYLPAESKLVMSGCTLRGSDGAALASFGGADIKGFENNTLEGNRSTLQLGPDMVHHIGEGNTFTGNDEAYIRVGRSTAGDPAIAEPATWRTIDVPYRVIARFFVESAWTIAAGATVEVVQDTAIFVESSGSLSAIGAPDSPIIIRGSEALPGYWKGIEIESVSANNVMQYVELSNAGSEGFNGAADSDGSVYLAGGTLALSDATVSDSGGYGIVVGGDGQLQGCANVTFTNNTKGEVYVWDESASSACP